MASNPVSSLFQPGDEAYYIHDNNKRVDVVITEPVRPINLGDKSVEIAWYRHADPDATPIAHFMNAIYLTKYFDRHREAEIEGVIHLHINDEDEVVLGPRPPSTTARTRPLSFTTRTISWREGDGLDLS